MAALTGGDKCFKYLLFTFNFIFWLAGTGVFAVGLWLRFDSKTKALFEGEGAPSMFFTGIYILIVAGALMMVVGFLGCCGAIQESPCMLELFFSFLLIILAIQVAAGIWAYFNKDKVVLNILVVYSEIHKQYTATKSEAMKQTVHHIQHTLNCCGPDEPVVYDHDTCPKGESIKSCLTVIVNLFTSKFLIIGGVGIGIGVIMIFGMIFSMMLSCAIRKSRQVV
ncbi:hypothetical protein AAFF_G00078060 [Aldrovandia affinis]|uniref:Tetraspanin n=1 Tax=Aldrovandia affinis TaxID=143900 RepID=A0AAD7RXZ7_9TELE|nr:hypothetical protein AAFF_G00078060 [Aldrovandia affinis]